MPSVATAQPSPTMPPLYSRLAPFLRDEHAALRLARRTSFGFAGKVEALPITIEEFVAGQHSYPIVFAAGENTTPHVLLGLRGSGNLFVDEEGAWRPDRYVPAYVRRYPFALARLTEGAEEVSLCFDPDCEHIGADGAPLIADGELTDTARQILKFCEEFEQASLRTRRFCDELTKLDLLIDGELTARRAIGAGQETYRGFRIVSEERLKALKDEELLNLARSGALLLIHAHLFSLARFASLYDQLCAAATAPADKTLREDAVTDAITQDP